MGTDWADVDSDGDFDLIAANLAMETNTLYINQGDGLFSDRSQVSGIGYPSLINVGFGCEFFDVDFDGDQDLMVVNGHVVDNVHLYEPSQTFRQAPQLLLGDGTGRFVDASRSAGPFFSSAFVSRGLALGDLDADGDLDVVVSDNDGTPHLLENQMSQGRAWIGFRLQGAGSNTAAIGARITIESGGMRQLEEVRGTSSYAAFHDLRLVFGLGDQATVDKVTVRWPDGATSDHGGLDIRRYHTLQAPR